MKRLIALLSLLSLATVPLSAAVETYKADPAHSSVGFRVRHFFTPVPGTFPKFEATLTVDREDLTRSTVEARIDAPPSTPATRSATNTCAARTFSTSSTTPTSPSKARAGSRSGKTTSR